VARTPRLAPGFLTEVDGCLVGSGRTAGSSLRLFAALKPICAAHVVPVMRPIEFEILLSLAAGARHGYAIIQDIEARGDDADVRVETGTLYRALQRLVEQGLVVPTEPRPAAPDDDARRRYYDLTPAGRHAAAAEARRLARLVDSARGLRLIPRSAG